MLGLDTIGSGEPVVLEAEGGLWPVRYREQDVAAAERAGLRRWRLGAWTDPVLAALRGAARAVDPERARRRLPELPPAERHAGERGHRLRRGLRGRGRDDRLRAPWRRNRPWRGHPRWRGRRDGAAGVPGRLAGAADPAGPGRERGSGRRRGDGLLCRRRGRGRPGRAPGGARGGVADDPRLRGRHGGGAAAGGAGGAVAGDPARPAGGGRAGELDLPAGDQPVHGRSGAARPPRAGVRDQAVGDPDGRAGQRPGAAGAGAAAGVAGHVRDLRRRSCWPSRPGCGRAGSSFAAPPERAGRRVRAGSW